MKNTYRAIIYFTLAILFITLGSLTLTGCGAKETGATESSVPGGLPPMGKDTDEPPQDREPTRTSRQETVGEDTDEPPSFESVTIEALLASPDSHIDKTVEVHGEVYSIGDAVGRRVTVGLSPLDETSVLLLKCEFLSNDLPSSTLKKGQSVTIIGSVDILEGAVFLRKCKVKDTD